MPGIGRVPYFVFSRVWKLSEVYLAQNEMSKDIKPPEHVADR